PGVMGELPARSGHGWFDGVYAMEVYKLTPRAPRTDRRAFTSDNNPMPGIACRMFSGDASLRGFAETCNTHPSCDGLSARNASAWAVGISPALALGARCRWRL